MNINKTKKIRVRFPNLVSGKMVVGECEKMVMKLTHCLFIQKQDLAGIQQLPNTLIMQNLPLNNYCGTTYKQT